MPFRLVSALAAPAALALVLIAPVAAPAQTAAQTNNMAKPGSPMSTDVFVRNVAMSNQFEIDSSRIALQKGRADEVKRFAQEMIDDHTKAGSDFQAALRDAGIQEPAPQADPHHKAILDRIGKASNIDGEYLQAQVKAHQDAVQLFQSYATNGDNATLKTFASNTLPTLQKHLREVEQLSRGAGRKTTSR